MKIDQIIEHMTLTNNEGHVTYTMCTPGHIAMLSVKTDDYVDTVISSVGIFTSSTNPLYKYIEMVSVDGEVYNFAMDDDILFSIYKKVA